MLSKCVQQTFFMTKNEAKLTVEVALKVDSINLRERRGGQDLWRTTKMRTVLEPTNKGRAGPDIDATCCLCRGEDEHSEGPFPLPAPPTTHQTTPSLSDFRPKTRFYSSAPNSAFV